MRRTCLFLAVLLLHAIPSRATIYAPVDFSELVTSARAVVHGVVVDVRTVRTGDRRSVETRVTLEARDYFKGDLGPAVVFKVPGGELGRYRTIVVGAPRFTPGDEVVLFLNARGPSVPWVSGLSQGVFRVARTQEGIGAIVTPPPLVAAALSGRAERIVRGDPARRPLALHEFARAVRAIARTGR